MQQEMNRQNQDQNQDQNQNQNQNRNRNTNRSRTLAIFCVSNEWYEYYGSRGNAAMVEASQIPALRRYCHAMAADAQLRETKNYLRSSVPAFFTSLNLWTSSTMRRQSPAVPDTPVVDFAAVHAEAAELKDKVGIHRRHSFTRFAAATCLCCIILSEANYWPLDA